MMVTRLVLKMVKLFIYCVLTCFFAAMLFRVMIGIQEDILIDLGEEYLGDDCTEDFATGIFTICYGLKDMSIYEDLIRLVYYAFTTLTTVGFGDFHPKSNSERIFIAFFMLFGVAIFSYILGNFIEVFD